MKIILNPLRYALIAIIFLLPLITFVFSLTLFFPYVTTKAYYFMFLTEIAFAIWIILAIFYKEYRFKPNAVFYAIATFVSITLIANFFGLNFYKSFWSNAERMDGFLTLFHVFLFTTTLIGTLRSKKIWNIYLSYLLAVISLTALWSLIKEWSFFVERENYRLISTLGNSIYIASLSVIGIFLSGFLFFKNKFSFKNKLCNMQILLLLIFLFLTYVIFQTGTRGALVGLGFGFFTFFVCILFKEKENKYLKYLSLFAAITFIVSISSFFIFKDSLKENEFVNNNNLLKRSLSISLEDKTTKHRLANWSMAIEAFKEKPILGWGQENYEYIFSKYYKAEKLYDAEEWFDRVHNTHLDKLVFSGLVGFAAYVSIFFFCFRYIWKNNNLNIRQRSMLTALITAHLVQNSFVFESVSSYIFIFSIFAYIAHVESTKKGLVTIKKIPQSTFIGLIIISLSITMYLSVIKPYKANKYFLKSINQLAFSNQIKHCPAFLNNGAKLKGVGNKIFYIYCLELKNKYSFEEKDSLKPFLDSLKKSLSYNTFHNKEITEKILYDQEILTNKNLDLLSLSKILETEAEILLEKFPNNNKIHLYYGIFLSRTNRLDAGENLLKKSLELGPEKFSNINSYAEHLLRTNDTQNLALAEKMLNEAYERGPHYITKSLLQNLNK